MGAGALKSLESPKDASTVPNNLILGHRPTYSRLMAERALKPERQSRVDMISMLGLIYLV